MNKANKKIAVVAGFCPYPPTFGGAVDIWERIKGIHRLGWDIDLIITEQKTVLDDCVDEIKKYVTNLFVAPRKNKLVYLFSKKPLQVKSREKLKEISIKKHYNIVLLEGEFCYPFVQNKTVSFDKLIVRIHNNEADYFRQLGQSSHSLKQKLYYWQETPKIKKFSTEVFNRADRLWYISKEECNRSPYAEKSVFMPFPINSEMVKPVPNSEKNVLYIGALFMQNNLYGLDWYIENVHSELLQIKDYQFFIVGSVKNNQQELNKKYGNLPNVRLFLDQPDITPFYQKAGLFINPMFHGSGVKVKSVSALVNGLPLVSTDIGAEGIGLTDEMFFRANNTEDFVTKIKHIFNVPADAMNKTQTAQQYLQEINYTNILQDELG